MKTLDKFFMKDKDSERLKKATEYFSARRKKEENVRDLLVRQEKLRNDWKRKEDIWKEERNSFWMGEEVATKENPMGRYGKRLKCLNCLSELHFIKDCREEIKCCV